MELCAKKHPPGKGSCGGQVCVMKNVTFSFCNSHPPREQSCFKYLNKAKVMGGVNLGAVTSFGANEVGRTLQKLPLFSPLALGLQLGFGVPV